MNKKPILSDHDKRHVLSAKKKQKVVLRNLLVQPFERYWPELTASDVKHFSDAFRSLYKSITSDNSKTTSLAAPTTSTSHPNTKRTDFVNKVILGLRSSGRCISSGKRLALFISSKIRPKYIVDQIILMAATNNTNSTIFCVPDLDVTLLEVLGFSCQCLAILEGENEIWNWTLEKSKHFPPPKSFARSKSSTAQQMDVEYREKPSIVVNESSKTDLSTLYLRKANTNERAFIPHGTMYTNSNANDFISLGETNLKIDNIRPKHQMISKIQTAVEPNAKASSKPNINAMSREKFSMKTKTMKTHNQQSHTNKVNYLALKVNRVQPNKEKIKKNKKKNKTNKK